MDFKPLEILNNCNECTCHFSFKALLFYVQKIKYLYSVFENVQNSSLFWWQDITDVTIGKRRYLTIDNMAGLEVTVDFGKLMQNCHIRHAWARTIHTFQVRLKLYEVV